MPEYASRKMQKLPPEMDPLRLGTGWTRGDLGKPQFLVESPFGDRSSENAGRVG